MVAIPQSGALVACDSCGIAASPEHIRARLERLELASRYRPIHIGLLLICTAPPEAIDDDLYAWERQRAGAEAREYLEGLFQSVGIAADKTPAERVAEFQRRGIYLARLIECPLSQGVNAESILRKAADVMVKRIIHSYKPARIAFLAPVAPVLAGALRAAGLGDKLIAGGQGIEIPSPNDRAGIADVRKILESALTPANPAQSPL
ncbi:MAG TPA: hypothetical protein VLV89_05605 [Candidatus Acidoferrum sp.]|nr:hypothetical protein [Candidatus Acidoferrum sp.]